MTKDEYEAQRAKNLDVAGKIIEVLIEQEMTLEDAQRALGYVHNRIEDQMKEYRNGTKIDEKYKKPLVGCYELPGR